MSQGFSSFDRTTVLVRMGTFDAVSAAAQPEQVVVVSNARGSTQLEWFCIVRFLPAACVEAARLLERLGLNFPSARGVSFAVNSRLQRPVFTASGTKDVMLYRCSLTVEFAWSAVLYKRAPFPTEVPKIGTWRGPEFTCSAIKSAQRHLLWKADLL